MEMTEVARPSAGGRLPRSRYHPPSTVITTTVAALLQRSGRPQLTPAQYSFISSSKDDREATLYASGDLSLLDGPAVAVVGARAVSEAGAKRARQLSRALAAAGVTVVSGLAKGVDYNAHMAALQGGGRTVGVIGTPLAKAYPAEHGWLQEEIAADHLLLSPFRDGDRVFPGNFPRRNRVMAAVTDGSIIIEASDSSGTLHQAAECQKLGRWLFIAKSTYEDPALSWPKSFAGFSKLVVLESIADVIDRVGLRS